MSIWQWADWITPVPEQHRVTLGEGNTPLVRSRSIGPSVGLDNLWLKLEAGNPAGSFKDRFGAAAISAMKAELLGIEVRFFAGAVPTQSLAATL